MSAKNQRSSAKEISGNQREKIHLFLEKTRD